MIKIDGSFGEGGGQILRTSLSLAAITKQPFQLINIRLQRKPKPRLRPQHLVAAKAVAEITNGTLEDAYIGSDKITYYPGEILGGNYEFDITTAGSAILVAQTLIPILLHAKEKSHIRLIGGTSLKQSPTYDYFAYIFLSAIQRFNATVKSTLIRSGYYPIGKGIIDIEISPSFLKGCINWVNYEETKAIIRISKLPLHILEREKKILLEKNIRNIILAEDESFSPGNVITIWNGFKGCTELGIRGVPAEIVAHTAVNNFFKETEEIDLHLADQLLIYAALAKDRTSYKTSIISNHLLTNIYTISHFVKRSIDVKDNTMIIN